MSDRKLSLPLLGCAGDDDGGAAQWARGLLMQPSVDAARVEQVPARWQPTDHLPDAWRREANGELLRLGGTLELERRINPAARTTCHDANDEDRDEDVDDEGRNDEGAHGTVPRNGQRRNKITCTAIGAATRTVPPSLSSRWWC